MTGMRQHESGSWHMADIQRALIHVRDFTKGAAKICGRGFVPSPLRNSAEILTSSYSLLTLDLQFLGQSLPTVLVFGNVARRAFRRAGALGRNTKRD
jgi:hypothetical protein